MQLEQEVQKDYSYRGEWKREGSWGWGWKWPEVETECEREIEIESEREIQSYWEGDSEL